MWESVNYYPSFCKDEVGFCILTKFWHRQNGFSDSSQTSILSNFYLSIYLSIYMCRGFKCYDCNVAQNLKNVYYFCIIYSEKALQLYQICKNWIDTFARVYFLFFPSKYITHNFVHNLTFKSKVVGTELHQLYSFMLINVFFWFHCTFFLLLRVTLCTKLWKSYKFLN